MCPDRSARGYITNRFMSATYKACQRLAGIPCHMDGTWNGADVPDVFLRVLAGWVIPCCGACCRAALRACPGKAPHGIRCASGTNFRDQQRCPPILRAPFGRFGNPRLGRRAKSYHREVHWRLARGRTIFCHNWPARSSTPSQISFSHEVKGI